MLWNCQRYRSEAIPDLTKKIETNLGEIITTQNSEPVH